MYQATDLVFAQGNEQSLCEMAVRLQIKHLILCYTLKDPLIKNRAKEVALLANESLSTEFAILVTNQQEVSKAKSLQASVVGVALPELFEDKRVRYIINAESGNRDDFIHHRNSGLNQVFLQQVIRTEKMILVNAAQLHGHKHPAVVLGRMMQNNSLYKKYKPSVLVVSGAKEALLMRSPRDLQSLLLI